MRIFDEMQKNVAKNECRFTYTFGIEQLGHIVSTLAITTLSDGFESMKILEQVLPKTNQQFKQDTEKRLQSALEPFGLTIKVDFQDQGDKKPVTVPDEELLDKITQGDN